MLFNHSLISKANFQNFKAAEFRITYTHYSFRVRLSSLIVCYVPGDLKYALD